MARYLNTAKDANELIKKIIKDSKNVDSYVDPKDLIMLYNLGIRTSPRPVQHTVRLRACEAAAQDTGVKVSMEEVPRDDGRGTYNALRLE